MARKSCPKIYLGQDLDQDLDQDPDPDPNVFINRIRSKNVQIHNTVENPGFSKAE
jgi:hypothetical protein